MAISENESCAIKYIRVGSMLAIVMCHLLQAYDNRCACILNIGVQVFLALSGYLYGKKNITNWKNWTIGRIKRVYAPVFLFLIAVLLFYLAFHQEVFSWQAYILNFFMLQGIPFVAGGGMLPGIRHLWFITAIMFAYFLTPVLQWLSKYAEWVFPILLAYVGISYVTLPMPIVFFASWFFLYAICYLYVHLKRTWLYDIGLLLLEILLVVLIASDFNIVTGYFHPVNRLFHEVSGIFIVIMGIRLLSCANINIKHIPRIVDLFDRYSFHVFVVHYFFIIGPFSLAHITPYISLNILIIVVVVSITTFLFVRLNDFANRRFFNKLLKI